MFNLIMIFNTISVVLCIVLFGLAIRFGIKGKRNSDIKAISKGILCAVTGLFLCVSNFATNLVTVNNLIDEAMAVIEQSETSEQENTSEQESISEQESTSEQYETSEQSDSNSVE